MTDEEQLQNNFPEKNCRNKCVSSFRRGVANATSSGKLSQILGPAVADERSSAVARRDGRASNISLLVVKCSRWQFSGGEEQVSYTRITRQTGRPSSRYSGCRAGSDQSLDVVHTCSSLHSTGWAKKVGPQTHDHNSAKS